MSCLRRKARISLKEKVTNEYVLLRLGTNRQLLQTIKQPKLQYYGHVRRKNNFLTTLLDKKEKWKAEDLEADQDTPGSATWLHRILLSDFQMCTVDS